MPWHEFVFSEKLRHRLLRHAVFWLAWWLYFSVYFYFLQQPQPGGYRPLYVTLGAHLLLKTSLLIFLYAMASYVFIYSLLPQMIKGKWLKAVINTSLLAAILFTAAYFMYWTVFPFVDSLFGRYKLTTFPTRFWPAVSLGLVDPLKVIAAVAIIKYVKYWWLKQQESERLEREKVDTELQLLKAQVNPEFLLTSLDNIYAYARAASPRAPEMLVKLSDLLSYMLYECDEALVPLEKEIEMMNDYISLEKTRLDNRVEVELNVRGDTANKMIAPFLLLPFIENAFKHSNGLTELAWINMDLAIKDNTFSMKLANGISPNNTGLPVFREDSLNNVQKRLSLIYPRKHELRISREREMLMIHLKIQLAETATGTSPVENGEVLISEAIKPPPDLYAAQ